MKLYRALAISLILIGVYVTLYAIHGAISDTGVHLPIRCNSDECRVILSDGTLSSSTVARPEGVTR